MANLFDTDYFADRKKRDEAAKEAAKATPVESKPESKEAVSTESVQDKAEPVKTATEPVSDSEPTPVKTVTPVSRKIAPEKRIAASAKAGSTTKLNYNIDKSKTSDVKGVNSRFLQILKQKLSRYGVTSNAEALNVFIASALGDYTGLSAETKAVAKQFREDDSTNSGKLIDAKLKRIEDGISSLRSIVDFNYYMVNALAMYTVNSEGFNKFQKEGFIDMTEPSLSDFVNRVSDTFMAMRDANKYSDGRPIR